MCTLQSLKSGHLTSRDTFFCPKDIRVSTVSRALSTQELRGTAIGIYYFGIYIGYSLSFAIGNSIAQTLGWRWVFFISGIAGVAVAPIVLFTVREPERKSNKTKTDAKTKPDDKISLSQRFFLLLVTFIMPGMFVLCLAGSIRNAGGYVWAYNTQIFFEKFYSKDTIRNFMSWIPLVGGSLGAVFGGVISDALVKGRGPVARIWVLFISQASCCNTCIYWEEWGENGGREGGKLKWTAFQI